MKTPVFEVWQRKDKQWVWRLISKNNRIIATGESHPTKYGAERALATVVETCKEFTLEKLKAA